MAVQWLADTVGGHRDVVAGESAVGETVEVLAAEMIAAAPVEALAAGGLAVEELAAPGAMRQDQTSQAHSGDQVDLGVAFGGFAYPAGAGGKGRPLPPFQIAFRCLTLAASADRASYKD